MTGLLDAIRGHARAGRQNAAFDDGNAALTWAGAAHAIARTRAGLGQRPFGGRPVGLLLDHSIEAAILTVALLEAGVPIVPLPSYFSQAQTDAALGDAGAAALVSDCAFDGDAVRFAATVCESAPAELPPGTSLVSFSSGSTGVPKGVCLSAAHLMAVATAVCDYLGRDMAGRHLPVLPFGILLEQVAGLFASLLAGGTYVPIGGRSIGLANPLRPDAIALLEAVERGRATSLILVPEYLATLVGAMEASGTRLPRLRLVAVGGASLPPLLLERAAAVGLPVRQGYGMTEAGSVITLENGTERSRGGVGIPVGAHTVMLADDGEIIIDGPLYLGLVGKPRAQGPFATGDLGAVDEHGQLRLLGRKSNLIVTSLGRNVSPEWIEGLLITDRAIAQAMVRGDGNASLEALLVPASPAADLAAAVERVNAQLPGYARVGAFHVVPPFTPASGQLTDNGRLRREAINRAYPSSGEPARFYNRLIAETREEQARFAMTPQLIAGLTGRISRADYVAYLQQAYHHVRHTVPLMQEARAGLVLRGSHDLVDALDDYIQEEIGHEEWILDDIAAAGGDRRAAAASSPAPATRAMVEHAYRVIRDGNPAAFFGMVFVLEGTSVAMASTGAAAVQRQLGLPETAFRYLTSHGALDQDHLKFFEKLMNRIDDASDQAAIIQMAKDMFRLFGGVFAAIELEGARYAL